MLTDSRSAAISARGVRKSFDGHRPGSAARLEVNAQHGTVQNIMESENEDTVQVYARNSLGNIIIRHATAA
jgi:hypothetical protein